MRERERNCCSDYSCSVFSHFYIKLFQFLVSFRNFGGSNPLLTTAMTACQYKGWLFQMLIVYKWINISTQTRIWIITNLKNIQKDNAPQIFVKNRRDWLNQFHNTFKHLYEPMTKKVLSVNDTSSVQISVYVTVVLKIFEKLQLYFKWIISIQVLENKIIDFILILFLSRANNEPLKDAVHWEFIEKYSQHHTMFTLTLIMEGLHKNYKRVLSNVEPMVLGRWFH